MPLKRKAALLLFPLLICIAGASWWYVRARAAAAVAFPSEVLPLLPNDVSMVGYLDMAALRDEPLVQRILSMAAPASPAPEYLSFVKETGFDYERDLDRVVLISTPLPASSRARAPAPAATLAIADGRFDQKKIEAYAERNGTRQQRDGRTIYTAAAPANRAAGIPARLTEFTFLSPTRVALATGADLSLLFSQHSADAVLLDQISRVSGSPVFLVAKPSVITPASGPAAPISTPMLSTLRWINLAARPDGANLLLSLEGLCDGPGQARQLASTLELVRGFAQGLLTDPKTRSSLPPQTLGALSQTLQSAQISTDAARVRLLLTLDAEKLALAPAPANK